MKFWKDGLLYERQVFAIDHAHVVRWKPIPNSNGMQIDGIVFEGTMFECNDYLASLGLKEKREDIVAIENRRS